MGFIERIKSAFSKKTPPERALTIDEAKVWLAKRRANVTAREKSLLERIGKRVAQLREELEAHSVVLEAIDVESIKAEEQHKAIMKGNLNTYLGYVRRLHKELGNLEGKHLNAYTAELQRIIAKHHLRSETNYQKATISIGKELAETKRSITNFSCFLKKELLRNSKLIEETERVSGIDGLLKAYKRLAATGKRRITSLEREVARREEALATAEPKEQSMKQQEWDQASAALKRETQHLRGLIDFKALGNTYHGEPKRMEIVKEYRERFEVLKKNGAKRLLDLLDDATANELKRKIERLKEKRAALGERPRNERRKGEASAALRELQAELRKEQKKEKKRKVEKERLHEAIVAAFSEVGVTIRKPDATPPTP